MVTHLLGTEDIDRNLEEVILEKTEGIPFFIEEFIKSLKDLKIIGIKDNRFYLAKDIQKVILPSTIQDVIMARVDSLPEGAKGVIQTGSVIEREFSYELIKRVTGLPEQELLSCLSILKDTELLYERGIYPQAIHIFKHALTQEVVYDSILTRKKKILHEEIGNAIEELYKDNLHDYYGVLAEHFINSENYVKGSEYCRLAGKKAEKSGSLDDAINYRQKQIACFEKLPKTVELEKNIIDARTVLGLYYTQMLFSIEAKATVDPIVDLAMKRNYKRRISQINVILGFYYHAINEDFPKALEYYEKAIKIGEELNDLITLVLANTFMGNFLSHSGEFEKSLSYFEKALEINVMANVPWGISAIKAWIAIDVYRFKGKIDLGYETSADALRLADESGDIYSKAHAYTAHGWSYNCKGYLNEAEKYLLKGADFSERINMAVFSVIAHFGLGYTYFGMKKYKTSQKHYKKAIFHCQQSGLMPSWVNFYKITIAMAKVMNREKDINLNEVFKWHEDIKTKREEVMTSNCIGTILLNIDDQHLSEAEDWIKKAIETNQKYGMMWFLAKDYALYAELFKRKGDQPKARENLSKAIDIFKECGADGWVKKYETELASL
jgi:tetratricopeptide (TPR) repeat protein